MEDLKRVIRRAIRVLNKNYKSFKKICNSLNYCFDISDIAPPEGNNYFTIKTSQSWWANYSK